MIQLHAAIFFASYAAFLAAVLTGVLYLVQERGLKRKDPAVLSRQWIPLEMLDRFNGLAVVGGFALYSFGLIQGYWLTRSEWGAFVAGDPVEIASYLAWAAYAAVLLLRLTVGLKGRRVILLSVMAFGFVVLTGLTIVFCVGSRHAWAKLSG